LAALKILTDALHPALACAKRYKGERKKYFCLTKIKNLLFQIDGLIFLALLSLSVTGL
jgi:hypothetical protein